MGEVFLQQKPSNLGLIMGKSCMNFGNLGLIMGKSCMNFERHVWNGLDCLQITTSEIEMLKLILVRTQEGKRGGDTFCYCTDMPVYYDLGLSMVYGIYHLFLILHPQLEEVYVEFQNVI